MTVITFNLVHGAVVTALEQAFPALPVLDNPPEPGTHEAYLCIQTIQGEQTKRLAGRYERVQTLSIQYVGEGVTHLQLNEMAEQLYALLEWVQVEDRPYPGSGMSHEVSEGILHFTVRFVLTVQRENPLWPVMANLEQKGGVKP